MNYLVLFAALGLVAIWIAALVTGGVASWFLWLVLLSAVVLLFSGATGLATTRRKIGKPV
ncbi:MAG: hypothetical protein ACOX6T_23655 [Myxococcales bacterium]|jgi:hypothetical protein